MILVREVFKLKIGRAKEAKALFKEAGYTKLEMPMMPR